jgi:hypothetical protein
LKETRIDIGEDVLFGPFKTKSVETSSVGSVKSSVLVVVEPPTVVGRVGTPVESAAHDVVTALRISVVVSTRLHDVDFTRARPCTIDIVLGKHPNGGPHPVTGRKLGLDLDTTELDGYTVLGADASRLDGVDNSTVGDIGTSDTVGPDVRRAGAICEKVDDIVLLNELCILKSRLDVKHAILDVCVFVGVGSDFELTVANTG